MVGLIVCLAFLIIFLVGILILMAHIKHSEKKWKEEQQRIEAQRKIVRQEFLQSVKTGNWKFPVEKLYKKCKPSKCFKIDSEADFQRVKLFVEQILHSEKIPKKYYKNYTSQSVIQQYMQQVEQIDKQPKPKIQEKQAIKLVAEEEKKEQEYSRYANKIGREKSLAHCREMMKKYREMIAQYTSKETNIKDGCERFYELNKQHESSWAIHGGIADAIAGPAAGLAVAIDVQKNNQKIQEENAALAQSVFGFEIKAVEIIRKQKEETNEEYRYWAREKRAVENILVQDGDERELLALLQPSIKNSRITATGAITFTVSIKSTPNLVIYDKVSAVVDGSFKILVKDEKKTVGYAICVIPYGGSRKEHDIKCICRNITQKSDKYRFEFQPNHLWLEEAPKGGTWQK